jgi:hypothetical protein
MGLRLLYLIYHLTVPMCLCVVFWSLTGHLSGGLGTTATSSSSSRALSGRSRCGRGRTTLERRQEDHALQVLTAHDGLVLLPGEALLGRCQALDILAVKIKQDPLEVRGNLGLGRGAHLEHLNIPVVDLAHNTLVVCRRHGRLCTVLREERQVGIQRAVARVLEPRVLQPAVVAAKLAHSQVGGRADLPAAVAGDLQNHNALAHEVLRGLTQGQQRAELRGVGHGKAARRHHRGANGAESHSARSRVALHHADARQARRGHGHDHTVCGVLQHKRVAQRRVQHREARRTQQARPCRVEQVGKRVLIELVVRIQTAAGRQAPRGLGSVVEHIHHHAIDKVLHKVARAQVGRQACDGLALHRRDEDGAIRGGVPNHRAKGAHDGVRHVGGLPLVAAHDERLTVLGIQLNVEGREMLLQSIVGRVGRDQIAEDIGRRLHFCVFFDSFNSPDWDSGCFNFLGSSGYLTQK